MTFDLALTPAGHLIAIHTAEQADGVAPSARSSGENSRLHKAFATGPAEGLFTLATQQSDGTLVPSVTYWRDLAAHYLTELCHTPEVAGAPIEPILPPASGELATILLSTPPMQGAEYLSQDVITTLWVELDDWVRIQITSSGKGLTAFLKERAPLWHQVGRVCFHLAENKRDPDYPFAFMATYAPSVSGAARIQYRPLSKALQEYAGAKDKKALIKLLAPVHQASQSSPFVKQLVESGDIYQPLAWTPPQAFRFLKEVPLYEESGVLVRLPDWWKKRPKPRVSVSVGDKKQKTFDLDTMLDFHVELALGDEKLTPAEWKTLLASEDGLVLLRGQWVEVDRQKLTEALDHWKKLEAESEGGLSFVEGMRLLAGAPRDLDGGASDAESRQEWSFVHAGSWLGDLLAKLRSPETLQQAQPGDDFKATLRAYQAAGVNWLWLLSSLGLGACLADDMGLGKTVQVLALLSALKRNSHGKPSLMILPASLLANWKSEMARFAPSLRGCFVHSSEMSKDSLDRIAAQGADAFKEVDLVLTTYGMLARQPWLLDVPWRLAVLDEAQAIKNPGSQQTKVVKRVKAESRIAMTGTPVENRLGDLWSLFDFLCPGLLGTRDKFRKFVKSLEERKENRYAPLRSLVQPYILRRLKTDKRVISDLPDKTEVRAYCSLGKRQAALYAKLVKELADSLESLEGIKRRGIVLAYLMRFKQLCNHPSQLLGDGQFTPEDSGKFARLAEICEEIAARQEKTLVFTQFREMSDPLSGYLTKIFGRPGLVLHGGTAVGQRKKLVDQFQRDDGPPFFVLSLKAGGTGLNLTAASHVIHFDRWWNPAVENQATDRAFRIGQRRNVLVHKFVCRGTMEEKIDELIEAKTQLAGELLEGGAEQLLTEMSDDQLIKFVSLDIDKASG